MYAVRPDLVEPATIVWFDAADRTAASTETMVWRRHEHTWAALDGVAGSHLQAGFLRDPTSFDEIDEGQARRIAERWGYSWVEPVRKYNRNHDASGRFASGDTSSGHGVQAVGTPGPVPHEALDRVLSRTATSRDVPMGSITPRSKPDPKSVANAKYRMNEAAAGRGEPRKPITVRRRPGGGYKIVDGNATFHAAQESGWDTIRVEVAKYNQMHDERGRFTGPGSGEGAISPRYSESTRPASGLVGPGYDDPTELGNLSPELRAKVVGRVKEVFGQSPADIEGHIEATLGRANPSMVAAGSRWYDEAGAEGARIGEAYGVSRQTATGVLAALSPQQDWPANAAGADYVVKMIKSDPTVPIYDLDATVTRTTKAGGVPTDISLSLRDKMRLEVEHAGGTFTDPSGKRLSSLDAPNAAAALKLMSQRGFGTPDGQALRSLDTPDPTGRRQPGAKVSWSCGVGNGIRPAVEIARGGEPAANLGGHKVRSFYNNMLLGSHTANGYVTIDTHAVSLALDMKLASTDKRLKSGFAGSPKNLAEGSSGTYAVFATAFRNVAARHSMLPQQVQAITWLQWRDEHAGERAKPRRRKT